MSRINNNIAASASLSPFNGVPITDLAPIGNDTLHHIDQRKINTEVTDSSSNDSEGYLTPTETTTHQDAGNLLFISKIKFN